MASWSTLRLAAKVDVSGRRQAIVSTAFVGGDGIYTADAFGGDVIKVGRSDLRERWRTPGGDDPAALYGSVLLTAGAETSALDAKTGRRLWSRPTRYGIVNWRGKPILKYENHPFEIVDPATGEATETLDVPRTSPMALCGDVLLFRTDPGNDPVRAYSLAERREVWARAILSDIRARYEIKAPEPLMKLAPAGEGRFVVTCAGWTFSCSLEDGSPLWGAPVSVPYHWPNVHQGRVYVLCVDHFIAVDEGTGAILYDVQHPELREAYQARPGTVYEGRIAFANESGHLAVFNLANGALVWMHRYKAPLWATAEADGRLLASTGDGKLLVFAEKSVA